MHGGRLTAKSDGLGKGSEFVVRLPTALPLVAGPIGSGAAGRPEPERGLRVLVIDDHLDTTQGLARLLRLLNHEVWTACDGPTGLKAARLIARKCCCWTSGCRAWTAIRLPNNSAGKTSERICC